MNEMVEAFVEGFKRPFRLLVAVCRAVGAAVMAVHAENQSWRPSNKQSGN
jgi:hypothetical protein